MCNTVYEHDIAGAYHAHPPDIYCLCVCTVIHFVLALLQIQGQILPAPVLQYGQRNVQTDKRPGSWEPGKYSVPGKMPSYAIASFADRRGTENAMNVSPAWLCPSSTLCVM